MENIVISMTNIQIKTKLYQSPQRSSANRERLMSRAKTQKADEGKHEEMSGWDVAKSTSK